MRIKKAGSSKRATGKKSTSKKTSTGKLNKSGLPYSIYGGKIKDAGITKKEATALSKELIKRSNHLRNVSKVFSKDYAMDSAKRDIDQYGSKAFTNAYPGIKKKTIKKKGKK